MNKSIDARPRKSRFGGGLGISPVLQNTLDQIVAHNHAYQTPENKISAWKQIYQKQPSTESEIGTVNLSLPKIIKFMGRVQKKQDRAAEAIEKLRLEIKQLKSKIEELSNKIPEEKEIIVCTKCASIREQIEDIVYGSSDSTTKEEILLDLKQILVSKSFAAPPRLKKNYTILPMPHSNRTPSMVALRIKEQKMENISDSISDSEDHDDSRADHLLQRPFKQTSIAAKVLENEQPGERKRNSTKFFSSTPVHLQPPGYPESTDRLDHSREEVDKQMPKRFPSLKANSMVLGKKSKVLMRNEDDLQANFILGHGQSFLGSLDASIASQEGEHSKQIFSAQHIPTKNHHRKGANQNITLEPMTGNDVSGGVFLEIPNKKRGNSSQKNRLRIPSDYTS